MAAHIITPIPIIKILTKHIKTKRAADRTRRFALKGFAERAKKEVAKNKITDCEAFVKIVDIAARLVSGEKNPPPKMIRDLQLVLIGNGLRHGRNEGEFVVRGFGASGFKKEFVDEYNQVQHAMAGIVIGSIKSKLLELLVLQQEPEAQDDRLYRATFPLGESLDKNNYMTLHERIRQKLSA